MKEVSYLVEFGIRELLKEELEMALSHFNTSLFEGNQDSTFCKLHEILSTRETDHNCIGCNLNDILSYSRRGLESSLLFNSSSHILTSLIINLYLVVERIDTILNIIELNSAHREDNFKALNRIRKWANFIKHPKAFILCHHPIYTFQGCQHNSALHKYNPIRIDDTFIITYYSDNEKNVALFNILENKENVLVVFPAVQKLIMEFVSEILHFNAVLRGNDVYRHVLADRTTFLDYWASDDQSFKPKV